MPFSPLPTLSTERGGDHSPECQGLLPFSEARWLGDAAWAFRQHISQKGLSLAPGTRRGRATNWALCMSSVLSIETSACEQRGPSPEGHHRRVSAFCLHLFCKCCTMKTES